MSENLRQPGPLSSTQGISATSEIAHIQHNDGDSLPDWAICPRYSFSEITQEKSEMKRGARRWNKLLSRSKPVDQIDK
tara:strand:- start:2844 stop:3077 length:234 start_codon:yes stop_codon:yes gene_type:complete